MSILENYPKPAINLLMNHIGTHDTARILTILGKDYIPPTREEQSHTFLSAEEYEKAIKQLKLAAVLQYTLPGVPSLYYGDEAGTQGYGDPFCRAGYPWGKENSELLEFYKSLGKFRSNNKAFVDGVFVPLFSGQNVVAYMRKRGKSTVVVAVNSGDMPKNIILPESLGGEIEISSHSYILK